MKKKFTFIYKIRFSEESLNQKNKIKSVFAKFILLVWLVSLFREGRDFVTSAIGFSFFFFHAKIFKYPIIWEVVYLGNYLDNEILLHLILWSAFHLNAAIGSLKIMWHYIIKN